MTITGTVRYQNLSGGFWGIIDEEGQAWRPESLPVELQREGLRITFNAKKSKATVSFFMWGTVIKILDYTVLE